MTAAALTSPPPGGQSFSIGAVLERLKPEFPDVSISKIRFLESEGLVTPQRTASRYRQYTRADVERLRYVLAAQRDHYLPLKVIKDQLDAIDRGLEPATPAARLPRSLVSADGPQPRDFAVSTQVRMSRSEVLAQTGLSATGLAELEQFGLVSSGPGDYFDADAVLVAQTAGELLAAGLEARHLRPFRTAAERQAGVVAQMVSSSARQKDPDARERAGAAANDLAATTLRLHGQLMKAALRAELGT